MEDKAVKSGERLSLIHVESDIIVNYAVKYQKEQRTIPKVTGRHLLLWPIAFLIMAANSLTYNTFSQYSYIQRQRAAFPSVKINTTRAYCNVDTNSTDYREEQDIQQKVALSGIYLYLAGGIPATAASFVFGSLTDRMGRKFLFYLPCFGMLFRTIWATVGIHHGWPTYMFIPGCVVEGFTGQVFSIIQVSFIYISDITTVGKQRTIGIVMVEIAFGLASSFPVLAIGIILEQTNSFSLPFHISIGMLSLALLLVIALPETFPKKARANHLSGKSRLYNIKDSLDLFCNRENSGKRWMYVVSLLVFTLTSYGIYGRLAIESLYLLNSPFCWGPEELGIFKASRAGLQQIAGMVLVILLKICLSDEGIAVLGCISFGASFAIVSLARTEVQMYVGELHAQADINL